MKYNHYDLKDEGLNENCQFQSQELVEGNFDSEYGNSYKKTLQN